MARYVVKLGSTLFALHPDKNTMFVTFKHREHAEKTMGAIKHFICTHKTLPPTYPDSNEPLQFVNKDETLWSQCMHGLYIDEISPPRLYSLCEVHNGGILEVQGMTEPINYEGILNLSFEGGIYEPVEADIHYMKDYLEYLL